MNKFFNQMTLDSKLFISIKTVWAMKCFVAIQESLCEISRSKNKYNTSYRSRHNTPFNLGKSIKL